MKRATMRPVAVALACLGLTCTAAAAAPLHLVGPLGFRIDEHSVRRAGVDYWHLVDVRDYENLDDFFSKNDVRCMRLFLRWMWYLRDALLVAAKENLRKLRSKMRHVQLS